MIEASPINDIPLEEAKALISRANIVAGDLSEHPSIVRTLGFDDLIVAKRKPQSFYQRMVTHEEIITIAGWKSEPLASDRAVSPESQSQLGENSASPVFELTFKRGVFTGYEQITPSGEKIEDGVGDLGELLKQYEEQGVVKKDEFQDPEQDLQRICASLILAIQSSRGSEVIKGETVQRIGGFTVTYGKKGELKLNEHLNGENNRTVDFIVSRDGRGRPTTVQRIEHLKNPEGGSEPVTNIGKVINVKDFFEQISDPKREMPEPIDIGVFHELKSVLGDLQVSMDRHNDVLTRVEPRDSNQLKMNTVVAQLIGACNKRFEGGVESFKVGDIDVKINSHKAKEGGGRILEAKFSFNGKQLQVFYKEGDPDGNYQTIILTPVNNRAGDVSVVDFQKPSSLGVSQVNGFLNDLLKVNRVEQASETIPYTKSFGQILDPGSTS